MIEKIELVVWDDSHFDDLVLESVNMMQSEGLDVEIQYQYSHTERGSRYTALVIGRKEESDE